MGVKIRERRNGKLFLDIIHNGVRRRESLGLTLGPDAQTNKETLHVASVIRQRRELAIISNEHGLLDPNEGKRPLVAYAEELAAKDAPKNPLPKSLRYLKEYAGAISLGAVNERWLDGYRAFLLERDAIGKATASKYFSALGMVLRRAVRDLILPRNPMEAVRGISTPEAVKVYLTGEELERLARTPLGGDLGAEVKRAFLFAAFTGLRVSDLKALTWGGIDRGAMQIVKRQEKTGRVVNIPLHGAAYALIHDKALHDRQELVFPRLTQGKTNTNGYIKTWAAAAGVDKSVGWHTARHTFAVLTLEGGADFYTVSKLMGHTKPQTTATYAKATDGMKRKAVDGLPDIDLVGRGRA